MDNPNPLSVLVVDDHDLMRRTINLALLAYDDIQWAGEARNGIEAVNQCVDLNPDVILMDLHMPKMNGVTAISIIRRRCPHVKIIAFTSLKDQTLVKSAVEAGANTYLYKDVSMDELADAIRSTGLALPPGANNGVFQTDKSNKTDA